MPNMWLGEPSKVKNPMARRGILPLGVLFSLVLLAAGCHKNAPAPEGYYGQTMISEERQIILDAVPDSARQADILTILDQAESRMREFTVTTKPQREAITALMSDRDATEEQIRSAYQAFDQTRHDALRDLAGYQGEIKRITFPNEWAQIADRDARPITN
jgi:hypothetical protein